MEQLLIDRIVEAALLAAPQPLTLTQLAALFPDEAPAPPGSIEKSLENLQNACTERGVELVEVASGFRYQVKTDVHAWVARLWTERQTKYTRATLETLALIAYRQPITRGEIEQIRGVTVNPNTINALEEREWIRVVGHRDVPGKPALFGTTRVFLDYFSLKSLDQLPPLAELRDIPDLEPELPFDAPIPAKAANSANLDSNDIAGNDVSRTDLASDDLAHHASDQQDLASNDSVDVSSDNTLIADNNAVDVDLVAADELNIEIADAELDTDQDNLDLNSNDLNNNDLNSNDLNSNAQNDDDLAQTTSLEDSETIERLPATPIDSNETPVASSSDSTVETTANPTPDDKTA